MLKQKLQARAGCPVAIIIDGITLHYRWYGRLPALTLDESCDSDAMVLVRRGVVSLRVDEFGAVLVEPKEDVDWDFFITAP